MGPFELLTHLLNFAAPALGLAVLMRAFDWLAHRHAPPSVAGWAQLAIHFGVGLLALVVGIWAFGRDGAMATYGLLVAGVASSQWVINQTRRL